MTDFSTHNSSHLLAQLKQQHYAHYLWVMLAPPTAREALLALLSLDVELAVIPRKVSEEMLGHIRFAWWQEAFEELELEQGKLREHPLLEFWANILSPRMRGEKETPLASQGGGSTAAARTLITHHRNHFEQHTLNPLPAGGTLQTTPPASGGGKGGATAHALSNSHPLVYDIASKIIQTTARAKLPGWQRKVRIIETFQEKGKLKPRNPWLMVRLLVG